MFIIIYALIYLKNRRVYDNKASTSHTHKKILVWDSSGSGANFNNFIGSQNEWQVGWFYNPSGATNLGYPDDASVLACMVCQIDVNTIYQLAWNGSNIWVRQRSWGTWGAWNKK